MKGKQNFILEGVTVILIITCDTKKGRKEERKEGRKEGDKFRSEDGETCSYSFIVERTRSCVHVEGFRDVRFPCTVELFVICQ